MLPDSIQTASRIIICELFYGFFCQTCVYILVIGFITAPIIQEHQNGNLILGTIT